MTIKKVLIKTYLKKGIKINYNKTMMLVVIMINQYW